MVVLFRKTWDWEFRLEKIRIIVRIIFIDIFSTCLTKKPEEKNPFRPIKYVNIYLKLVRQCRSKHARRNWIDAVTVMHNIVQRVENVGNLSEQ